MNRALPAHIIDRIRDGVDPIELRERGDAAVWHHLVSTAGSAIQRGWTRPEWAHEITKGSSLLGVQVARKHDTYPPKDRSHPDTERTLRKAWDTAEEWVKVAPPATTREDALQRVAVIGEALKASDLGPPDRAVMEWAITEAQRLRTDRPALPRRGIVTGARIGDGKLGERAVRCALQRLIDHGWLVMEDRGMPGSFRKRAALYRLSLPAVPAPSPHTSGGEDCGTSSEGVQQLWDLSDQLLVEAEPEKLPSNVIPFQRRPRVP